MKELKNPKVVEALNRNQIAERWTQIVKALKDGGIELTPLTAGVLLFGAQMVVDIYAQQGLHVATLSPNTIETPNELTH